MPDIDSYSAIGNDSDPAKEEIASVRDPLNFDLDDKTFLEYAKQLRKDADDTWATKGPDGLTLKERRQKNVTYLFGRQFNGQKRKKYNSTAQDNVLWEASKYLRAMATSKLPDMTVTPGSDSDQAKKMADEISKVLTSDIQKRQTKQVLGLAFEHIPAYYCGVIKHFWNPQKGRFGNYDIKVIHPDLATLDPRAASNDVRDMDFLFETVEYSVKELIMMFPEKEQELYTELRRVGKFGQIGDSSKPNEKTQKGMNSKVKIEEVWFKWYDRPKEGEKKEWEQIIGVGWYFGELLLRKIKHPYWDWSGTPQTFTYELKEIGDNTYKKEKQPVTEEQLRASLLSGQPAEDQQTETVFHNHLDYPKFPYTVIGANQWGNSPLDETSDLEQSIPLQENYDKRQRQEDEIIDRSRGKHVFSSNEGMNKDDVKDMDLSDPEQDILIKGKVNELHGFIPGEQPSPALIQDKTESRERIFDKRGVHQATRGQVDNNTAATNTQISREGDFTRMDDYVDDTITYAAEDISNWRMQFIKLFYTESHLRRVLGPDGQWVSVQLQRDLLDDGMEVVTSASGSDKLKAEQRAMDMAKMKLIDPFRFYKDIGASDPKGRSIALMTFLMQPDLYLQDIKAGGDGSGAKGVQTAANVVQGQEIPGQQPEQPQVAGQPAQSPQAQQDIMLIMQGQIPPIPQQMDPAYLQTMTAFLSSPDAQQLLQQHPELQDPLSQFAQAITQMGQAQPPQQPPASPGDQFGQAGTSQPTGPLSQNPSPGNTSRINAIAGR